MRFGATDWDESVAPSSFLRIRIVPNPNPSPATRFEPGTSGNPGGRPKGESFQAVLRDLLEEKHRKAPDWRYAIAARMIDLAAKGDLDAAKWIADRTDGRVKDEKTVEHGGKVEIEVTYTKRPIRALE